jgi:predicted dehydrogenase
MNIITIGFGNMGCRHTQSMLNSFPKESFWILEPSDEIFQTNSVKIGVRQERLHRIRSLDELSTKIDFAIVATSAFPRFDIVKALLEKGVKNMLVEKVVFQSETQFKEIEALAQQIDSKIYCNFVNRYFPNYQTIKSRLTDSPLTMTVLGGDFGLGCNALHYIDLFEYLTGKYSKLSAAKMDENEKGNRRGNIYKEVLGQLMWETEKGDRLVVSADEQRQGGNEIIIIQDGKTDYLNEESLKHYHYAPGKINSSEFRLLYTSSLTGTILKDILKDKCILPTIEETISCHVQLFHAVNPVLGLPVNDLCPIT